ncbi:LPP20 family lipoprotein [Candidatus Binatia bacterium]|nr:LPP20 family lipoprotein [Candidatus Binatia bacterium]
MKRVGIVLVGLSLALATARAASEEAAAVPREVRDSTQIFTERMMVVKGEGAAPSDRPLSGGQKRLMALRAAKVIALRELAETLSGVRVAGETCVQDAAAKSDQVKAAVDGVVRGAEVVHESYDERTEVGTVYVRISLDGPNGLARSLLPKMIEQKAIDIPAAPKFVPPPAAPPPAGATVVDALIVDAKGRDFRPALVNRIVAGNGSVLFEPSKIAPEILAKKGCGDYTDDLGKARAILASHGAKSPLVIQVTSVVRSTDAQISEGDAAAIFTANQKGNFLEAAQVVFVL